MKIDLADHIIAPENSVLTDLQHIAQDVRDLEQMENELVEVADEMDDEVDDETSEKAFNLNLAVDVTQIVRKSLSRALCLLTSWAPKMGVSTIVDIDNTRQGFIVRPGEEVTDKEPVVNTVTAKGQN
jgi:hypothetical protein